MNADENPNPMTCQDFLDLWNRRLDAPASLDADALARLDAHAEDCPECRQLGQALARFAGPLSPPAPSEGLADRILAAWDAESARGRTFRLEGFWQTRRAIVLGLTSAAAATLLAWAALRGPGPRREIRPAPAAVDPARPWTSSLAEATSATLDLARETSGPAARLGQDVLSDGRAPEVAWPVRIGPPSPEVLETVSRRVQSGVKPISQSALRAFSFLAPAPRRHS